MRAEDLRGLLAQARDLNQTHDVTGFLFYIERHFIQCIEGAQADIGQLVDNIRADARNTAFSILFDRDVPTRAFIDWAMGYRALPSMTCGMNLDSTTSIGRRISTPWPPPATPSST